MGHQGLAVEEELLVRPQGEVRQRVGTVRGDDLAGACQAGLSLPAAIHQWATQQPAGDGGDPATQHEERRAHEGREPAG